jgi:hypothetical protein
MTISILIVDKTGSLKSMKLKEFVEDDLYKKAGNKSVGDFKKHATWKMKIDTNHVSIHVYGKTKGRAGQENKYDFPPPIDNTLFFGSCVVVCKDDNHEVCELTEAIWKKIYEKLFGGFEDIGDEDSEESEDEEEGPRTKEGYLKDGFIVEDDEDEYEDGDEDDDEDEDEDEVEDEDEDEELPVKKPVRKIKTRSSKKTPKNVFLSIQQEDDEYTCTSELSEESYD